MKKFLPGPAFLFALIVFAGGSLSRAALAQDGTAIWNSATRAAFDPAKVASVSNLVIERDKMRITLASGTIQFSQPVNGRVFAAAFEGQGQLQIGVADPREQQQLRQFLGEDGVNLTFTEAAFDFSADAFADLSAKLTWGGAAGNLENTYQSKMHEQEEHGSPDIARIVQSLLSTDAKKDVFLKAYLKTSNHGWVIATYDARDAEEISLGRWVDRDYTGQYDDWLSFPAAERLSSDAFHDPLEKAAYSVDGYQMQVTLAADTEVVATATVKLQPHSTGERALLFDLNANLRVDSVKDENGVALPFFQAREPKERRPTYGDYLAVVLPAPLSPGEHSLVFHYAGKKVVQNAGSGNYFVPSYGWYPSDSVDFAVRTNFDLTFTYPKRFLLVATGDKTGETSDGKQTTSTWKNSKPLAVAGFAFGDYQVSTQKVGDVEVDAYVNRNQDDTLAAWNRYLSVATAMAPRNTGQNGPVRDAPAAAVGEMNPATLIKTMNTEMANALRVFEEYYGPFPYDRIAVTNIPYSYGQGWPMLLFLSSLSFLDSTQQHAMGITDQIGLSDFFRAHEMSHQWWGHKVGWKSYHDQWMSEGFAQFSGNLYVQFREDPNKYFDRIRLDKQKLLSKNRWGHVNESLGPIWMGRRLDSSNGPDGYDVVVYNKGGLVLHALRMLMRDTQNADADHFFKDMMKDFCQTYDNQAASTEDFKSVVEKHMVTSMDADGNHRMDWFFNQYVYGTGIPEYKLNYKIEQAGDKWVVSGAAVQNGVPEGWKDELRLYVTLPGKPPVPVGWLRVPGKSSPFKFQLATKPEKLSLNEYEDTLAVIK